MKPLVAAIAALGLGLLPPPFVRSFVAVATGAAAIDATTPRVKLNRDLEKTISVQFTKQAPSSFAFVHSLSPFLKLKSSQPPSTSSFSSFSLFVQSSSSFSNAAAVLCCLLRRRHA